MKKLMKVSVLILLFAVTQSCSDVLDTGPSTSIPQETALNTKAGVKGIRASMYTSLFNFGYNTEYMVAPSSLADGLYIAPGSNRFIEKNTNNETIDDIWDPSYNIIQKANLLINAVGKDVISPNKLKQFKAEAYFMRAFAMHNLARAYSYEPNRIPDFGQGADFRLGIIIRTEAVLGSEDIKYKGRSTILETYEQIESDLLKAISLFKQVGDEGTPRYASLQSAKALLARVYLYWQKWGKADKYATDVVQSGSSTLTPASAVGAMFSNPSSTQGVIFRAYISDFANAVTEPVNNGKAAFTSKQWVAQVPTQDVINLYSKNDARLTWFRPCLNELNGTTTACNATHPAISSNRFGNHEKQGLELAKWDGSLSDNLSDHIPYFRVAEMVLIQAEARLKSGGGVSAAIERLNILRSHRGLKPLQASNYTASKAMKEILEARRREFIGEGQRFWDLKRLGMTIQKAAGTLGNAAVNPVEYNSFRILSRIPTNIVSTSKANAPEGKIVTQNPGY